MDGFDGSESEVPVEERRGSTDGLFLLLNTLVKKSVKHTDLIYHCGSPDQDFVCDNLSNWYVRLNRKRFWGGGLTPDKIAAYQTLYEALKTVALLSLR